MLTEADRSYSVTAAEQRGVDDGGVWIGIRVSFTLASDIY